MLGYEVKMGRSLDLFGLILLARPKMAQNGPKSTFMGAQIGLYRAKSKPSPGIRQE